VAIQFRASATNTNASSTTLVINKPTQTADGDVMIAILQYNAGSTITPPAGWVQLTTIDNASYRSTAFKKIASGEGASWTWTFGTASQCTGSVISFVGGWDVLHYAGENNGTSANPKCFDLAAARDGVGYTLALWQNSTGTATVTASFGSEVHDINVTNGAVRRGQAGYYYGPSEINDIVNAGDNYPSPTMTISVTPTQAATWTFIVADKAPDTETWSSTNGSFAVELKLDEAKLNTTGSIDSIFKGDITGKVAAISSSGDNPPNEIDDNLADGLSSTKWLVNAATGTVTYDFGVGVTKTVRRYRLTSANDNDGRDPMNWTLEGSQNNSSWTTLDTRTNEAFGNRFETREFKLNGTPAAYRYYRLNISSNQSGGALAIVQLAEWRLSEIDVWEDITSKVLEEDKIRITRGLQGSSGRSDFSRAYVNLRNTDGRFSLLNADGPYYGALQRNTQMRISKAYGTKTLQLQGDVDVRGSDMIGDSFRCPVTSAISFTGDLEVQIDFEPKSWRQRQVLAGIQVAETSFEAWTLYMDESGILHLAWEDSVSNFWDVSAEVPIPQTSTRLAIKVTLDVNNGASGNTVTFYTAPTIGGSYTQLGDAAINSGTTDIAWMGGALCVGHVPGRGAPGIHGLVYAFKVKNGIGGTDVTNIDFTTLTNGIHTYTDSNSNRWITVGNAVVSNRRYRFHGEVAEWPISWDTTGDWVTASVTGAGIQKRLERGNVTQSTMRRYHTKGLSASPGAFRVDATAYAYWPMEDSSNATQFASGIPGRPSMFIYGNPTFGQDDGTKFHESMPLAKVNGARYGGPVIGMPSGYIDLRWMMYMHAEAPINSQIMEMYSTGSIKRIIVAYNASNTFVIQGYNESDDNTINWNTGNQTASVNGELAHCQLILDQSGSDVAITFKSYDVYGNSLGSWTATFTAGTIGRIFRINPNPAGDMTDTYFGHIAAYGEETPTVGTPAFGGSELNAHIQEPAASRIKRLCQEENIEFRLIGAEASTEEMGYQTEETPFNLMSTAAVSDDGYLIDPLDAVGVLYRTGRSLYNQPAALTLSYTAGDLSEELVPVQDDSYITNDFTANRGGAGSSRYQQTDGNLSVNNPPDGVGPYEDSQEYSLGSDGQTIDIASWQVHKGVLDEMRFPAVNLALENLRIAASTTKTEAILKLDVGQRIDITNTPDFLPNDDIRQIVIGYEETFDKFQHGFKLNTLPERIWEVAEYDQGDRFQQFGSTLYQDVTASATSLRVTHATGQSWSASAADFDIVVDGERMTATTVANASDEYSTDTFNRANSTTNLGSTDGGVVSAWNQRLGTWGINGNQAYISVSSNSMATIPGSADFEEVSATLPAINADAYVMFRYSDNNNRWRFGGTVGSAVLLQKVVAGVTTTFQIGDIPSPTWTLAAGDTLKVRAHGSVIECFKNGKLYITISDTFNSTQVNVGMQCANTATRFENFAWISDTPDQTFTVTRAVNGVSVAHKAGAEVKLYQVPYRGV
jgi:F5/8 type C domain-containing protein